jgi:hypothetical protein
MSKWSVIKRFIPRFWEARRKRNEVKSYHIYNLSKLETDQTIQADFQELDESALGEFAARPHFKMKSKLESVGYPEDSEYVIHDSDDRRALRGLMRSTIWRIRIKNIISIVFWIIFLIFLLAIGSVLFTLTQIVL